MKKLSICICVYNKFNFTKSCLQDLSQLPNDHEIIVVDNGSTDETESQLKDNPRIIYYRNSENKGFSKGSNKGYQLSTAPNVLFLNNDIRVKSNHSDWTNDIIKWCQYAIVGPTMGQLDKNLNFVREANQVLPGNSYMSGWCVGASKDIWSKLDVDGKGQIFSEEFGRAYFEDTDLSFRARKLNIPFQVVDIPVVHFGKQTSSQLNTHQLYSQARQIFVKKWSNKS